MKRPKKTTAQNLDAAVPSLQRTGARVLMRAVGYDGRAVALSACQGLLEHTPTDVLVAYVPVLAKHATQEPKRFDVNDERDALKLEVIRNLGSIEALDKLSRLVCVSGAYAREGVGQEKSNGSNLRFVPV